MKQNRIPVSVLVPLYFVVLAVGPVLAAALPALAAGGLWTRAIGVAVAPMVWSASYLLISILMAFPFRGAVISGKFPRDVRNEVYGPRRMYGMGWGAFFYCTPLYFVVCSLPALRRLVFRGFGYRGSDRATIAPDAWIRDLPLLDLADGAYVANKSTIGTNMCLAGNTILVDRVSIGTQAMVGHLAMVAPGVVLGAHSELGVGGGIGIRAKVGARCRIGPQSTVNHGAILEDDVEVGTMSYVGVKSRIAKGIRIPSAVSIPEGSDIRSREDLDRVLGQEHARLLAEVDRRRRSFPAPDLADPVPAAEPPLRKIY